MLSRTEYVQQCSEREDRKRFAVVVTDRRSDVKNVTCQLPMWAFLELESLAHEAGKAKGQIMRELIMRFLKEMGAQNEPTANGISGNATCEHDASP